MHTILVNLCILAIVPIYISVFAHQSPNAYLFTPFYKYTSEGSDSYVCPEYTYFSSKAMKTSAVFHCQLPEPAD